ETKPGTEPPPAKPTRPPPAAAEGTVSTPIGPSARLPYPEIAAAVFADDGRPAILPYEEHGDCKKWITADYLYWIVRRDDIPGNLVTNGPPGNTQLLGG